MSREELTEWQRIRAALIKQREEMRQKRHEVEMETIYDSNLCPICHKRHMAGVVCRWHRGCVCEKHCIGCRYHEPRLWHCTFREKEPIDMRKWKLIYGSNEKDHLWKGIWQKVLMDENPILSDKSRFEDKEWSEAYKKVMDSLSERTSPKYEIRKEPDENGDYAIVDTDTGEIQGFVAKFLKSCGVWACVEYLPAEA